MSGLSSVRSSMRSSMRVVDAFGDSFGDAVRRTGSWVRVVGADCGAVVVALSGRGTPAAASA
jgi:hypothetical protein